MSNKNSYLLATAAAGALLAFQTVAHAQTGIISFEFVGNSSTNRTIDPTLTAGVVPAMNFNTDNGGNTGSVGNLAYSDGSSAPTTVSYNSYDAQNSGLDANSSYRTSGNQQLLDGFIESGPPAARQATATVTVSAVPYTTYSLYVYFFSGSLGSPNGTPSTGTYTVSSGTAGTTQTSQTAKLQSTYNNSTPFTLATANTSGDYLVFTGLTSSSFTLTANRVTGDASTQTFIPIDGFQIVRTPAATPEPAAFIPVVLGLGMIGLLAAKRRLTQGVGA